MTTAETKWQTASGNATSAWNNAETAATNRWKASEAVARAQWKFASDAAVDDWNLEEANAVSKYNTDVKTADEAWKKTNDDAYTIYSSAYDAALTLWNSKQATAASEFTNTITSSNATAAGAEANAWATYVNASNGQMLGARLVAFRADPVKPQAGAKLGANDDKVSLCGDDEGKPPVKEGVISVTRTARDGEYIVSMQDGSSVTMRLSGDLLKDYLAAAAKNGPARGVPPIITEGQAHQGKIPVAPEVKPHLPQETPKPAPKKSLAIGTNDDKTQAMANWWNRQVHDLTMTIDLNADDAKWDAAIAELKKIPDGSLTSVVFAGHGSPVLFGPFTLDDLDNPNSKASQFLTLLKLKMATNAVIEIKACNTAAQEKGIPDKKMLKLVAKITQRKVIGYDDIYGPVPHGQGYIVHPDGTVADGVKYPRFEDTLEGLLSKKMDKIQGILKSLPRMDRLP